MHKTYVSLLEKSRVQRGDGYMLELPLVPCT